MLFWTTNTEESRTRLNRAADYDTMDHTVNNIDLTVNDVDEKKTLSKKELKAVRQWHILLERVFIEQRKYKKTEAYHNGMKLLGGVRWKDLRLKLRNPKFDLKKFVASLTTQEKMNMFNMMELEGGA